MYLLDTDIVNHLHADHPKVIAKLAALPETTAFTSIVTRLEILRGRIDFVFKAADWAELQRAQQKLFESEALLGRLTMLQFDQRAGALFDRLRTLRGLGRVGRADLLIACIALAHNAVLVTRNTKDFVRIPNLKLENWLDD
jgi:tRNA(fMet)-specific endonuclease VapC